MALIENALIHDYDTNELHFGKINKVDISIKRLKMFEPPEGYFLCFSGGKDSVVLKTLADMAKVKYQTHYHVTTIDPPELIRFIHQKHPDIIPDKPELNMWDLIVKKGIPPTRLCRYCCAVLKEKYGKGKIRLTGVRWDESQNRLKGHGLATIWGKTSRKKAQKNEANFANSKSGGIVLNEDNDATRRTVEMCYRTTTTLVNPIIEWTDADIWEFIKAMKIPYCGLYDEGFSRIGCVGCPLGGDHRYREFERWPGFKERYIRAFDRMLERRRERGKDDVTGKWTSGEAVFAWWMEETPEKPYVLPGQLELWEDSYF